MIDLRTLKTLSELADVIKQINAPKAEFGKRLKEMVAVADDIETRRAEAERLERETRAMLTKNESTLAKIEVRDTGIADREIALEAKSSDLAARATAVESKEKEIDSRDGALSKAESEFKAKVAQKEAELSKLKESLIAEKEVTATLRQDLEARIERVKSASLG